MSITSRMSALPAAFACLVLAAAPARSACFESGVGCTDTGLMPYEALRELSCDSLWSVRNMIYDERGYCFKTERAQEAFDNSGCLYDSAALVPLNDFERQNIRRVVTVEREKDC